MENTKKDWAARIFEIERDFYGSFSGVHRGDGFKMYHRNDLMDITDCNHAVIDLSNGYFRRKDVIETAIDEIESFYEFIGLPPRIYQGFYEEEFGLLEPILKSRGYVVEAFNDTELYVFDRGAFEEDQLLKAPLRQKGFVELQSAQELDPKLFLDVDGHLGWHHILCEMLEHGKHRLFAGFDENKMVSIASAQSFGEYCRIDHVKTLKSHRSQGYCHGLMHAMMKTLGVESSETFFYLYASKPEAIKPYTKSGFKKVENTPLIWGGWKDEPINR